MLRQDIEDIVAVLHKKTSRLLILTNGYFTDEITNLARKFPDIAVRISVDGLAKINDEIRGIPNGFDHTLRTAKQLKELKLKDVGFSTVISDRNIIDLLDLYHLAVDMDLEFSVNVQYNSFYLHKNDNKIENKENITEIMDNLIKAMLNSKRRNLRLRIKDCFRAYLYLGLLCNVRDGTHTFPCGVTSDNFFLDPYGKILACNRSQEPWIMGDLKKASFEQIWNSEQANKIRTTAGNCNRNCWDVNTATLAAKKRFWIPFFWLIKTKLKFL